MSYILNKKKTATHNETVKSAYLQKFIPMEDMGNKEFADVFKDDPAYIETLEGIKKLKSFISLVILNAIVFQQRKHFVVKNSLIKKMVSEAKELYLLKNIGNEKAISFCSIEVTDRIVVKVLSELEDCGIIAERQYSLKKRRYEVVDDTLLFLITADTSLQEIESKKTIIEKRATKIKKSMESINSKKRIDAMADKIRQQQSTKGLRNEQ